MPAPDDLRDQRYNQAIDAYGAAIDRMARAWEANTEDRRDLLQEIHLALWRSFANFDGRCSLRTWVYRVAHNAATSHVLRGRRWGPKKLISLEELDAPGSAPAGDDTSRTLERTQILERLYELIQRLNPLDRQVILLYLEGMDAASIGEVTGISPGYVATKIHRIKAILADRFRNGGNHEQR
jgi:RNA polymerase sigma-70 factor (ECF subfamily)